MELVKIDTTIKYSDGVKCLFDSTEVYQCDAVRIIVARINTEYAEDNFEELVEGLYPERQIAARKLKLAGPRATSIAAGYLLQYVAKEEIGLKAQDIEIEKEKQGKPHIKGHEELVYNLSHSKLYVGIAYVMLKQLTDKKILGENSDNDVDKDVINKEYDFLENNTQQSNLIYVQNTKKIKQIKSIGFDVEEFRDHSLNVAKRCFCEGEYKYIINGDLENEIKRFFQIWTMKEAYLKATGTGISVPMNSFEVNPFKGIIVQNEKSENPGVKNDCVRYDTEQYAMSLVVI